MEEDNGMDLFAASDGVVAGIGAAGAVVGTLVGGLLTYGIERSRERTQRAREREADARVIQGVARVWSKALGDFYVVVDDYSPPLEGSVWWADENDTNSEIDVEDIKRVAAAATAEQWREIDYALTHIREARAARALARSRNQAVLSQGDVVVLKHTMERVSEAIKVLAQLSGDTHPPQWLNSREEASQKEGGWRHSGQVPHAGSDGGSHPTA